MKVLCARTSAIAARVLFLLYANSTPSRTQMTTSFFTNNTHDYELHNGIVFEKRLKSDYAGCLLSEKNFFIWNNREILVEFYWNLRNFFLFSHNFAFIL